MTWKLGLFKGVGYSLKSRCLRDLGLGLGFAVLGSGFGVLAGVEDIRG